MENRNKRETTCMFTGHRQIPTDKFEEIRERLVEYIEKLCEEGICCFMYGGALGFDMLAAECVLEVRSRHPHIHLILVSPCEDQCAKWQDREILRYLRIKARCTECVVLAPRYYNGCMQKRNRYMADNSSVCIAYLHRDYGGTAYTVEYSRSNGLRVIFV